jgi:lipoprotein-releasing system permease protein
VAKLVDARDLKSLGITSRAGSTPAPGTTYGINNTTMYRPVSLFIGLRYSRAKRRNHFISFFSLVSIIGIALGVTVLITVLSVMNGFDHEIRHRIFSVVEHVTIGSQGREGISDWASLEARSKKIQYVIAAAPFIHGQAVLSDKGSFRPILVNGILPEEEKSISSLAQNFVEGSLNALMPGEYGIVLGQGIADDLGLTVGDKVTVMTPTTSITPVGIMPRYKRFTVVGVFHYPGAFKYDDAYAYIHLNDAQKLYQFEQRVSGIHIRVDDLYHAIPVSEKLSSELSKDLYQVSDWTAEYGTFFKAIRMEKTMMFIILVLIVAVAVFNLVSSLVMLVTDKRSEIAILRTIGASPGMIMRTFITQGFFISVIGVTFGVMGGVILALNAPMLVDKLQSLLNTHFVSASVYFIDTLPSRLQWSDVWHIALIALVMGLVATIYPAWSASKTRPAEALRYE